MVGPILSPGPGLEPVPGYCLEDRLGSGGYGEVWRAHAPGGFQVAMKFVPLTDVRATVELRALDVIRDVRHPNLLVTFASWQVQDWLIIGMELADKTLLALWQEVHAKGLPGIPRDELLELFLQAARGIDFLNDPRQVPGVAERIAIQHRDIKPPNILLVGNGVKVGDFGLARVVRHGQTGHSGRMTPSYAAPEFFTEKTSSSSDQYCLAVTYCKMRGGRLPFEGSFQDIVTGHLLKPPDLAMIPEAEREVVARALSKNPKDRWPSCRRFVEGLLKCSDAPNTIESKSIPKSANESALPTISYVPKTHGPDDGAPPASRPHRVLDPSPVFTSGMSVSMRKPQQRGLCAWVIGREHHCDVTVQDAVASARHCRLTETTHGFFLEDLGSSNGTYVNGHSITKPVHVLPTDRITLGLALPMPWPVVAQQPFDIRVIQIGRDPENDVVLDYPMVSGRHARIIIQSGLMTIEDLGSTNGLAIGSPDAKISHSQLSPGDTVFFGSLPMSAWRLLQGKSSSVKGEPPRFVTFHGRLLVLGRDPSCDVVLDFPMVSARHARLRRERNRVLIEDSDSSNGTFVNGRRIEESAIVKPGDVIGLGSYSLEFRLAEKKSRKRR